MLMQLMKIPILLPLNCLNLIEEAAMGPHLKGEYQILLMQVATAQNVMQAKNSVFIVGYVSICYYSVFYILYILIST